jgi:hypothetical protein
MVELRAQEQQILKEIEKLGGKASVEQLMETANLPDAAIMRNALVLQEKALINIKTLEPNK